MTDSRELRSHGLKVTLPRLQILELFQHAQPRHLTAEDVYRQLFQKGHDIGLATVYRVLTQMHQAGLLKQSRFEADRAIYELDDGDHHDHLVCTDCGRVQEFHDDTIEQRQQVLACQRGFELIEHSHVLYARCTRADCEHRPPTPPQRASHDPS